MNFCAKERTPMIYHVKPSDTEPKAARPPHDAFVDRRTMPDELEADAGQSAEAPIRSDLVARVKRQIKLGMYEEEAKLDAVLDRLAADVLALDDEPAEPADADSKR